MKYESANTALMAGTTPSASNTPGTKRAQSKGRKHHEHEAETGPRTIKSSPIGTRLGREFIHEAVRAVVHARR